MNIIRKNTQPKDPGEAGGHVIFRLLPYWPMFLGLLVLAVAGSIIYLKITPAVYEATAKILINEHEGDATEKSTDPMASTLSPKQTVENEQEVMISNPILYKVVEDLGLYVSIFQQKGLSDILCYKNAPLKIIAQQPNSLSPVDKTRFRIQSGKVIIAGKTYPFDSWLKMSYGTIMFSLNPGYKALADDNFHFSITTPKKVVSSIAKNLKVSEANKLSTILKVSLQDQDQRRAEDILNEILEVYSSSTIEKHNLLAANTQAFIDKRLIAVERELLDIEHKLQDYRSERGAIDVGTQGKLYLENVSINDQKVGEINMQLSVLNQVENYVRSKDLSGGIVPSTAGISDAGLSQMVKDIYELQLTAESLRKTTGENNPMVVSYIDQINKIKPQILQNLRNQRNSLAASRNNLQRTTNTYSSVLQSMPETERNLVGITRQQQIKSGIYTLLLRKKEETALSYITNGSDSKIISRAESTEFPVSPKRKMVLLASMLAAGILGFAFVFVKEGMRRNVMFQSEIKSLTALPVIAEISADRSKNHIVIGPQRRTLIAEQFRSLRTTLHFLGVDGKNKRVMVTSAISGEGKSFVASNLAVILAMTGKRVALLDFDLNHPTIHHKFNIKQTIGISEYLEGKVSEADIIQPSQVNQNLSVLLTGKLPADPAELILNGKAAELLNYLDNHFDFIIIDVPPVGPVSDAYTLAPLCDATLFVVRHAYTPKVFVQRIDENIRLNNLPNPAIVFNAVAQRGFGKNNYGYGYGSGMVYGGSYDQKLID